ncbi:MAG: hypothetical protein FWG44_00200 [Oscillospiraceae bacterium]|nr:hypothetical protein [Oscillospiraceae bacterium]
MKIKKITALLLALCLIIGLTACGGDKPVESSLKNNTTTTTTTRANENASTTTPEVITASDPEPIINVQGGAFSDGVAWVKLNKGQWHCLDKTGTVLFELEENHGPASDFLNGTAWVQSNGKTIGLVDKTGKIIPVPESNEYDEIFMFIYGADLMFVKKHIETFEVTEDRVGLIDINGNWKVELSNDIVWTALLEEGDFKYLGEGFVSKTTGLLGSSTYLYNISECKALGKIYDMSAVYFYNNRPAHLEKMENGIGFYSDDGFIYYVDKSGTTTKLGGQFMDTVLGNYSNELFYAEFKTGFISETNRGFYDVEGNIIIDLSEYDVEIHPDKPEFIDGYCLLSMKNPQGSEYYTIIDKTGKQMFEPKLYNYNIKYNGGGVYTEENTLFNINGEMIAEIEGDVSFFCEGIAVVNINNEFYYIDTSGKRLF